MWLRLIGLWDRRQGKPEGGRSQAGGWVEVMVEHPETDEDADGDYSYTEVGATRASTLPPGYDHLYRTGPAGRGPDDFRTAAEALMC